MGSPSVDDPGSRGSSSGVSCGGGSCRGFSGTDPVLSFVSATTTVRDSASSCAGVISLCPAGDEPRLRSQLSWLRSQLHAAQLERARSAGELNMAQHRLRESEAMGRAQAAEVAALQARLSGCEGGCEGHGGGCAGGYAGGGACGSCAGVGGESCMLHGRVSHPTHTTPSPLMSLAESRLTELEAALASKDIELARVQASSWGGWAQDAAVHAELRRLQDEVSQAHVEVVRLSRLAAEAEAGRAEEAREREEA
eukprot:scaffold13932_cov65-Isochrysis_galbana.AAC.1